MLIINFVFELMNKNKLCRSYEPCTIFEMWPYASDFFAKIMIFDVFIAANGNIIVIFCIFVR